MLNFIKQIKSKQDNTIKYIYNSNNSILEFSSIDKNDGKDIICVPCATTCNLGCKFCFLTGLDIKYRNLTYKEIYEPTDGIIFDIRSNRKIQNKILLISFMGCGEPLLNIDSIIAAATITREDYKYKYDVVRFALASLVPNINLLEKFIRKVKENDLKFKFHYSLHTTNQILRKELMPGAATICIDLIKKYMEETNNSAEIHYTLMDGINDSDKDAENLCKLLGNTKISAKLLKFAEKEAGQTKSSKKVEKFKKILEDAGIITEYYEPPGSDIGSSCGQFLLDYYKDKNENKINADKKVYKI